ncbi:toxin glutamine deamidase domain-containing protein [Gilliamella sp. App2-1]|uniref:toxin glutamine deamidase domain-containing protein n=1 Tax=Gilliamella sp. App2-1 TaxID=3120230 RepID=UPI00094C1624|nr:toxin glutamine deamidase domain-containing protein [Gilliamella apicola]
MNEGMSAMGSETRQGIDMAVNLINGIISGDMTGAVAGALAPKIASAIKKQTEHYNPETGKWETDHIANTVSHAILGAVVAELQGNSGLVGGLGAAIGERGAEVIAGILYPDKDIKDLSQEERQQISALSQLATGLAIAAAGGDIQDINTGVAAGKNAVENNRLLTPTEKKRIDELVKGNEREDLLYRAAACALIHCSAGLADDDPDKAAYLALEELGNSPELESYREQLKGQTTEIEVELPPYITGGGKKSYKKIEELFEYTTGNKISDTMTYYDSKYSISTRAGGTLQVGMAVVDGMAAVALSPACASVLGCLPSAYLTWSMVDNGATGLMVIYNGKTYHTQTAEGLSKILGVSASDAELLFSLSTGGVTAKGLSDLAWKARATGQKLSAKEVEQINEGINRVKAGKGETNTAVNDVAGTIRDVNPGYPIEGRTHNCVNCAIATDATLGGNPASALPINSKNGVPISVLEKQFGTKFQNASRPNNIIEQMSNAGSGARGIVFGSYGPGQPGHVFNVVNQNGKIRFLDGQTGKAADMSKFKSFKFLRTN